MSNPQLLVVIASTRPGRVGLPVGRWFEDAAKRHGKFDVRLADLAEVNLPIFNEPNHPATRQYVLDHTKAWSQIVAPADAFALVTPEYNFGPTPALVNAMNYLYHEWSYKPAGFVSYGGISGGVRAVQVTKLMLTTLKIMPMYEAVTIPNVQQMIEKDASGAPASFKAGEVHEKAAKVMLDELRKWSEALKTMRTPAA
jgi:NAD(P)H-dependent FMN reductase